MLRSKPIDLSLRGACLDIEYYYVRLCGFSPTAHMFESSPETHPGDIYVESLSQFAEEATEASVSMLELAIQCFTLPKPFTYAAVRYWLYIFCASLYLLKASHLASLDTHIVNSPRPLSERKSSWIAPILTLASL